MTGIAQIKLRADGWGYLGFGCVLIAVAVGFYRLIDRSSMFWGLSIGVMLFGLAMCASGVRMLRFSQRSIHMSTGFISLPRNAMSDELVEIASNELLGWTISTPLHPLVRVLEVKSKNGDASIVLSALRRQDLRMVLRHLESMSEGGGFRAT